MKTGAFNTKIIYNHLLAVALACIVSLLFVHRVCQFLNTSSKRLDFVTTSTIGNNETQKSLESCCLKTGCDSKSRTEGCLVVCDLFGFRFQPHRFMKPLPISTIDQYININVEKKRHSKSIYRLGLPPMRGPSIPIVHRRLII